MRKYERIIIKISLVVLFAVFFSSLSTANAQNMPLREDEDDSIYIYYALENTVNFFNGIPNLNEELPEEIILIDSNIKKLEDVTKQQIDSVNKSEDAMTSIKEMGTLKTFILGNKLGILKFQMVQMKTQSHILQMLALETTDSDMTNNINTQIEILEKEQEKVENFIFEQDGKFSLFGWLLASL